MTRVSNLVCLLYRFERIYLDTTWGLPALQISWKLIDPTQTFHKFDGFFKALLTSMHSLIYAIEMKGIFFQMYYMNKNKNI